MFSRISRHYDLLNHLLSFGMDIYWRRQAIRIINFSMNRRVLDLGTGTGDMALLAAKKGASMIFGADISQAMLEHAVRKFNKKELGAIFNPVICDAGRLPFRNGSMDAVMCAFSIRNTGSAPGTVFEIHRVLAPCGVAVILEFSKPKIVGFREIYRFYFHHILPRVGGWISGDTKAYRYLPESVDQFPAPVEFRQLLTDNGFTDVRSYSMSGGIVTVYVGMKL